MIAILLILPIDCLLCSGARPSCAGVGASMKGPLFEPMSLVWLSSNEYDLLNGRSPLPWWFWGVWGVWGVDGCLCLSLPAGRTMFTVSFLSSVFTLLTAMGDKGKKRVYENDSTVTRYRRIARKEIRRKITVKLSVIRSQLIVTVLRFREAGNGMADPSVSWRGGIGRDRVGFAHNHTLNFHLVIGNQALHGYGVVAITGVCNRITEFVLSHMRQYLAMVATWD